MASTSPAPRSQRAQLFDSFRGRLGLGGARPSAGQAATDSQQGWQQPSNAPGAHPDVAGSALSEEEQIQLALAISASEASSAPKAVFVGSPAPSTSPASPGRRVRWTRVSPSQSAPSQQQQQQQQQQQRPAASPSHPEPQHQLQRPPSQGDSPAAAPAQPAAAPVQAVTVDTSSDEALARALQAQLDAQQWVTNDRNDASGAHGSGAPGSGGGSPPGAAGRPHRRLSGDRRQSPPSAPAAPRFGGASQPHPHPQPMQMAPGPTTQLPAPVYGQQPQPAGLGPAVMQSLGSFGGSEACGGCGKPVRLWQTHASAGAKRYHSWCLTCAHCRQQIQAGPGTRFAVGRDQQLYHEGCHRNAFHPKCSVCTTFLPEQNGIIRFHHHPFWNNRFCPGHETDGTPRCTACNRLQINGEQWIAIDGDRHTCLECLATMVRNTADCQPLYDDVLSLFASFGMPLPTRPPLLLVESAALNEASHNDHGPCGKKDGPVFHTRGLTLSEEHRSIRTVMGSRRDTGFMSVVPQFNTVENSRWEVTALLVLYGLPWLLTGSILAHEVMHAWLRLSGFPRLSMDVEEGLAQLMALLWLERQTPRPGSFEERLAAYLGKQIREDTTAVYGDGFRAAHEAFQNHGLPAVLEHVRRHGTLPLDGKR